MDASGDSYFPGAIRFSSNRCVSPVSTMSMAPPDSSTKNNEEGAGSKPGPFPMIIQPRPARRAWLSSKTDYTGSYLSGIGTAGSGSELFSVRSFGNVSSFEFIACSHVIFRPE
jgi:hypothetical protein